MKKAGILLGLLAFLLFYCILSDNTDGKKTGSFTDTRDSNIYKTVTIATQTWMAENLNYEPSSGNSWCYDNKPSNCDKYGRLYDWNTALKVCPEDWHLPSDAEWTVLENEVGGSTVAGKKLKSATDWNGTDDFGFNALPAGLRISSFDNLGSWACFWSATETENGGLRAWYHVLITDDEIGFDTRLPSHKNNGLSVRCLQD
jgi:uncharacterized protein (TIGR02145 family)